MLQLPPIEALEAIIESGKHGSFSGAAAGLELTHGAVSRRVAAVEAWAGYPIFERHGRGVKPTEAGHALIAHIEHAIALLKDGRSLRKDAQALDVVRLGIVPSFARMWLFPHMARLEGTPPDLRIEPEIDNDFMALSEARIAIRYGLGDWPNVRSVPMFEELAVPVACRAIAETLRETSDPQELLSWPLLHDAASSDWTHWLGLSGVSYAHRGQDRTFQAYDLTLQAAAQGLGIALLRKPYGLRMSEALALVPVTMPDHALPRRFYIVVGTKAPTLAAARVIDRISNLAKSLIQSAGS
ncbi:LysR family glycine cleavage system transcriptional activator [Devosia sp. UYZn731]|uniref:LysR substrate-binding domain-containing protein n=1 Tax=Devosia sp. UYZn731 TaxID=3156345 RepID=UPI00339B3BA1